MSADEKHGVSNIDNSPDKLCEPLARYSLKRPPEEGIVAATTNRQRIAKPIGKPRRPLSGYNVFFKEERGRWTDSSIQRGVDNFKSSEDSAFRTMTKAIGKRWRDLSADQKLQYQKVASADMKRYRKEMDEYKLQMIRDTAIGRVYLERRLLRVSGTPEYRDVSQQLPQTRKDIEGPQASSPDIQSIAVGEVRHSMEVKSTQRPSDTTDWTASSDTTYSRQAFSRTNPSVLENLLVVQKRICDASRGSFMATSHQNKWNQQTQQGASGSNEKAEPSSKFQWEMMRMDPVTPSKNSALMEAELQSSLSSFTQRNDAAKYERSNSTSEVNPSAPTDVTYFVQEQLLPSHLQLASPDATMAEHLSSRILQRLLLSDDDKHTPHINSTTAHSAQSPMQHQPILFENPSLGCISGLQSKRSVIGFLMSQNLPLPTDQRQWREHVLTQATSNIAMQLIQTAPQYPLLLHPVHFATPFESSLWPHTLPVMPLYSANGKMAAGENTRAQIAFEYDYNCASAASDSLAATGNIYSRFSSHFPLPTLVKRAVTGANSEVGGPLVVEQVPSTPGVFRAAGQRGKNTSSRR